MLSNKSQLSPDTVLTPKNRESCVRRLKLYPAMTVNDKARMAAVLVPLCTYRGELGLLYTLRSTKLNSNKGQVSFPGGMKDDSDKSLEDTALRETWEELRIPVTDVDVWSSTGIIGRKNLSVMPVLGFVGEIDPQKLEVNPEEVEEAFVISLEKLCDPKHFRFTQFRNGFLLPAYTGGKYRVWGLTAAITHMMMKALIPEVYNNKLKPMPTLGGEKHDQSSEKHLHLTA